VRAVTRVSALAEFFRDRPLVWIDGADLGMIAGRYAWRSRISDLRHGPYFLDIEMGNDEMEHREVVNEVNGVGNDIRRQSTAHREHQRPVAERHDLPCHRDLNFSLVAVGDRQRSKQEGAEKRTEVDAGHECRGNKEREQRVDDTRQRPPQRWC
jgi:hypothetical protein